MMRDALVSGFLSRWLLAVVGCCWLLLAVDVGIIFD